VRRLANNYVVAAIAQESGTPCGQALKERQMSRTGFIFSVDRDAPSELGRFFMHFLGFRFAHPRLSSGAPSALKPARKSGPTGVEGQC